MKDEKEKSQSPDEREAGAFVSEAFSAWEKLPIEERLTCLAHSLDFTHFSQQVILRTLVDNGLISPPQMEGVFESLAFAMNETKGEFRLLRKLTVDDLLKELDWPNGLGNVIQRSDDRVSDLTAFMEGLLVLLLKAKIVSVELADAMLPLLRSGGEKLDPKIYRLLGKKTIREIVGWQKSEDEDPDWFSNLGSN